MSQSDRTFPYGKIIRASEIGELVRRKRKEIGMRQADLAALAGVGTRFLSELENGKETAEMGRVLRVCRRLGLDFWILPRGTAPAACAR